MGALLRDLRREFLLRRGCEGPGRGYALYLYVETHARDFEVGELLLEPSYPFAADSYPITTVIVETEMYSSVTMATEVTLLDNY